jgi:hypothetical protein
MTKNWRPAVLACVLAGALGGVGCNPLTLVDFIGPEPQVPAELAILKPADKKASVRVVVLTDNGVETREEFLAADRQLTDLVTKQLKELAAAQGAKLEFVNLRKVEEYKSAHPHWKEDARQAGTDLKADYVIYLEINDLSMYEKGSRELFRGHADISVSLYKVADEDGVPEQKHYNGTYPTVRAEPVDMDTPPAIFREKFLKYVAKHIAWYFMDHPTSSTYMDD